MSENAVRRILFVNRANQKAFNQLVDSFASKTKPIAFVGAGVSARSGYPTWNQLIKSLLDEMSDQDGVLVKPLNISYSNDVLWQASACREALHKKGKQSAYYQVLRQTFAAKPGVNPVLDSIVSLPFSHFLTTNYDPSIHAAFERLTGTKLKVIDAGLPVGSKPSALGKLGKLPKVPACIHLHGIHSNPEGIILTEADYRARYFSHPKDAMSVVKFLESRAVVFFGFSMQDADFMDLLRMIRSRTLVSKKPNSIPNFAFLPLSDAEPEAMIDSEKERLLDKYRIQPIFYRRLTEDFTGLGEAVSELVTALRQSPKSRPAEAVKAGRIRRRAFSQVMERKEAPDPDDPNKGEFGGVAVRNGRRLSAKVAAFKNDPDWFRIILTVTATDGRSFVDPGKFHVHPSFPKPVYDGKRVSDYQIERKFWAYGAFTVGAVLDGGKTRLELDLAKLPNAPKLFKIR